MYDFIHTQQLKILTFALDFSSITPTISVLVLLSPYPYIVLCKSGRMLLGVNIAYFRKQLPFFKIYSFLYLSV